jgi:DHA1 family tetracycline resistance protein-like MFS transporter
MSELETIRGGRARLFIIGTVAIDALGIGILAPIMPKLLEQLTGAGLARAAIYGGWLTALFASVQFFAAPILGNLSDRFGRRPVLLPSLFAFGASYVLMGIAPSIGWLFVAQALAGVFGATFSTAGAYIADVTEPLERAKAFGLIGAAFGAGFIFGPLLGGFLSAYGIRTPFFAAAALALLNVAYGLFVLPESLPPERRRPFVWRRANPLGALLHMRNYQMVYGLLGAMLLLQFIGTSLPATWPYFMMQKFGWTPADVSLSLALYGVLNIVIQGGLMGQLQTRLGTPGTVFLALGFTIVGYAGYAFGDRSWIVVAFIVPTAIGFMAGPGLSGLMSSQVPATSQGELQGAIGSLQSLAAVIAPIAMTRLFSIFAGEHAPVYFPGAPYIASMLLAAGSLLLVLRATRRHRQN